MKRVLLLSAYRSDSHAFWSDWLQRNIAGIDWQVCELPGRHFAWRIRSNPLSWLDRMPAQPPDLIVATSMVDLATLRGLQPQLAGVPVWYYFHENQLAYPVSKKQIRSVEPCMVQLYGALAADRLLFNSAFNRDSFLDGIDPFLAQMPDGVPDGIRARLAPKCRILPVPVEPVPAGAERDRRLIVWNHRWEYDKRPEVFAEAMLALTDRGIDFRIALLGRRHRNTPDALRTIREKLPDRIMADGRVSRERYRELLGRAGIAVSTAAHEFQGLGMLEAASAGARPLVPDALCYREQYPDRYRYPPGDVPSLVERLASWIEGALPDRADVSAWTVPATADQWRAALAGFESEVSDSPGSRSM